MREILFYILILYTFVHFESKADIISLVRADQCETIIEIFIEDDRIRVTFEIGEKDYPHFYRIIPEEYFDKGLNANNRNEFLNHFFKEGLLAPFTPQLFMSAGKIWLIDFMGLKGGTPFALVVVKVFILAFITLGRCLL